MASSADDRSKVAGDPGYPRECDFCQPSVEFSSSAQFSQHLRACHSVQEGGSFLCRYGDNGVCLKLPIEGVCDVDFEAHIRRCHLSPFRYEGENEKIWQEPTSHKSSTASLKRSFTLSRRGTNK
ncbi:unnamed protein product [Caenorhabditis auriculariae]|uniref:Uncharacterized protein n=1 Tax=Caenorhabditis auriculariae TaxID=2777116 RepID=A0A8S1HEF8_9PELO|nr:unnamed protein product [Caenorhabditis auriculariae]